MALEYKVLLQELRHIMVVAEDPVAFTPTVPQLVQEAWGEVEQVGLVLKML